MVELDAKVATAETIAQVCAIHSILEFAWEEWQDRRRDQVEGDGQMWLYSKIRGQPRV